MIDNLEEEFFRLMFRLSKKSIDVINANHFKKENISSLTFGSDKLSLEVLVEATKQFIKNTDEKDTIFNVAKDNLKIRDFLKRGVSLNQNDYVIKDIELFNKIMQNAQIDYSIKKIDESIYQITIDNKNIDVMRNKYEQYAKAYEKEQNNTAENTQKKDEDKDLDGVVDRVDINPDDNRIKDLKDIDIIEKEIKSGKETQEKPSLLKNLKEKQKIVEKAAKNKSKSKEKNLHNVK